MLVRGKENPVGLFKKIVKKVIGRVSQSSSSSPIDPVVTQAPRDESQNNLANIECTAQELKERIEAGVYPLRLRPEIVGILGSSQPETIFFSTSTESFLLLIIV